MFWLLMGQWRGNLTQNLPLIFYFLSNLIHTCVPQWDVTLPSITPTIEKCVEKFFFLKINFWYFIKIDLLALFMIFIFSYSSRRYNLRKFSCFLFYFGYFSYSAMMIETFFNLYVRVAKIKGTKEIDGRH
mgnify:CR=1 FL=1